MRICKKSWTHTKYARKFVICLVDMLVFLKLEYQYLFGASKLWNGQFLRNTNVGKNKNYNPPCSPENKASATSCCSSNWCHPIEKEAESTCHFFNYSLPAIAVSGREKNIIII